MSYVYHLKYFEKMDKKEIWDTLKAAKLYLNNLKSLDHELESAVKQVLHTFEETERNIHETFSNLKETLVNILNNREKCLLEKIAKIKEEGLGPLEECRKVISDKVISTNKLIDIGDSVINGKVDNFAKFNNDASLLGSLPEVPELKEVPFISFHFEPRSDIEVKDILAHFGEVCKIAPIQITELLEKPGAILVEWHSVDNEERLTDIQEFRLQRAFGDVVNEKHLIVNFNDCYCGLDTQFLVKDLQPNQPYSFRVCCKFEGSLEWSPWSLPQVFATHLNSFSWRSSEEYVMLNENKIAKPVKDSSKILFSDGPQFHVGHSVEFTFLEVDTKDAIVGLISQDLENSITALRSAKENSFLLDSSGRIFVDGTEKSTILPNFTKGLKICFTCDLVNNQKIRVNIDSNEKRVTYDWTIEPDLKMFFVAQFMSSKWKIMVE